MSLGIHLSCDVADCKTPPILGTEAIDLVDPPPRDFRPGVDHGHMQLCFARDLTADLSNAALAAGWKWDGNEWTCPICHAGHEPYHHSGIIVEHVAHSMNV